MIRQHVLQQELFLAIQIQLLDELVNAMLRLFAAIPQQLAGGPL